MTINELLALNNLTANDQIPVWDAEATGSTEPTAKITVQNFSNAVKTLASLIGTGDLDATPTQGSTKAVQSGGVYTAIQQSTANMARSVSKSSIAVGTSCTLTFSTDDKCSAIISVVSLNSGKYATYIYEGYGPSSVRQAVTPLTPGNTHYTVKINDDRSVTITPSESITSQYWVGVLMVLGNPPTIT